MDSAEWQPPTEEEMKVIQAKRERSDKISKLMSGYLLKGYKMLGTVCAQCETILLQDREGTKYCVACSELDSDTEKDNPASSRMTSTKAPERAAGGGCLPSVLSKVSGLESTRISNEPSASASLTPRLKSRMPGVLAAVEEIPGPVGNGDAQTLSMSSIDIQCWPANPTDQCPESQWKAASASSSKVLSQEPEPSALTSSCLPPSRSETMKPKASTLQYSSSLATQNTQSQALLSAAHPTVSASISVLWEKINWASQELKQCQSLECSIHLCTLIKTAAEAVDALKKASM